MYITEDRKADIIIMYKLGKIDGVLKELIKLNQQEYERVSDRYFVWYNLGLIYYKRGCMKEANFFTKKIYKEIIIKKDVYEMYYYNVLWLYAVINKKTLKIEELKDLYFQIHTYYKKKGSIRNEYGVLSEIYKLEKDEIKMLNLIFQVLTSYPYENELIDGLLKDSKCISENCYKEALEIKEKMCKYENNPIL